MIKRKLVIWQQQFAQIKSTNIYETDVRNRDRFQNLKSVRRKPPKNIDIDVLLKDIWQIVCDAQTMKPPSAEMAFVFLAIQGLFHAYGKQDMGKKIWVST